MSEEHRFTVASSWDPKERQGEVRNGDGSFAVPFSGAPSLGGRTGFVNPEELVLAALQACFVQTWAIFLAKLRVPVESPVLEGRCELEKDPAGGYRLTAIELLPHVPKALLDERAEDVEKTLELAERYCIVSKALRGEGRTITVTPLPV